MEPGSLTLAKSIATIALDGLAEDAVVLDLRSLASFCDFFVICQGRSPLHVEAIHDRIVEHLREQGVSPHHREGGRNATWIVLDFGDVVVHIFDAATREFYALETLWGDAERIEVEG